MRKQLIVSASNLPLVAMLGCAGYPYRFVPSEGNYLFTDTGDIDLMVEDFEKGTQSITDCKALLTMYESLRSQQGAPKVTTPHGESKELVRVTINTVPGKEWVTRDIPSAAILSMRGSELLDIELSEGNKAGFWFSWDPDLQDTLKRFNRSELLVEPRAWNEVQFQLRERLRKAQSK